MSATGGAPLQKARRGLRLATAVLCGTLLLALTFVTVIDVIGRYLLLSPLPGAAEYTELLLMAIIFCGLPAVCLDDGHISVDVIAARLTGWWHAAQLVSARLFVAVVLSIVSWQLWKHGQQLASYSEMTVFLRAPIAPFAFGASIITGICAAMTFLLAVLRMPEGSHTGV